jgi:hypothetical protein
MAKYQVNLNAEEREELRRMVSSGRGPARAIRRAQILLKSDEGYVRSPGWRDPPYRPTPVDHPRAAFPGPFTPHPSTPDATATGAAGNMPEVRIHLVLGFI